MSRSEMAHIPCVLLTASQVLTTDTKITKSEVKIFNFLADDAFRAAVGALLPMVWHRCPGSFVAECGVVLLQWCFNLD